MKHTPTPWTIKPWSTRDEYGVGIHSPEHGEHYAFAKLYGWNEHYQHDAAFIVRAVNNHERLLEALKQFFVDCRDEEIDETLVISRMVDRASAAIKAAEEEA